MFSNPAIIEDSFAVRIWTTIRSGSEPATVPPSSLNFIFDGRSLRLPDILAKHQKDLVFGGLDSGSVGFRKAFRLKDRDEGGCTREDSGALGSASIAFAAATSASGEKQKTENR